MLQGPKCKNKHITCSPVVLMKVNVTLKHVVVNLSCFLQETKFYTESNPNAFESALHAVAIWVRMTLSAK